MEPKEEIQHLCQTLEHHNYLYYVLDLSLIHIFWPGRLQILSKSPLVLTDAGHNPDGIAALCQALDTLYQGFSLHVIMTMMQDKAYQGCISSMAQRAERFYACTLDLPRALTPEQVARVACPFCACLLYTSRCV